MDRGSKRKTIFEESGGANEKRFETVKINWEVMSKFTNHPVPDFKRYVIRDHIKDQIARDSSRNPSRGRRPQPDYKPNVEYTKKSLGLGIAAFEKA